MRALIGDLQRAGLVLLGVTACQPEGEPCEHELTPETSLQGMAGQAFDNYEPEGCVPDEQAFEDLVRPQLEASCGECHGEEPAFGAPMPLLDYASLMKGTPGNRLADRIALRTAARTMPPPSSPQLDHDALDLLVEWATCGEVHPDHSVGLEVDRERYAPDVPQNLELPSFDVTAPDFAVDRETLDLYQCFAFDVPVDEPRYLRRIQVALDDARVLHHVVVMHDPRRTTEGFDAFECDDGGPHGNTPYLWAWAPGTQAFDFEEGGLLLEPEDRIIVQIHYNNGAGLDGVRDSSGVRVFHGPVEGPQWKMISPGAMGGEIPEGESAFCGTSNIPVNLRVLAGLPHMHELGAELHTTIERADGSEEPLINLTGWNFEAQHIYRYDQVLEPGDKLHTWCGYRNDTGKPAQFGLGTADEMCFNFMYVTGD